MFFVGTAARQLLEGNGRWRMNNARPVEIANLGMVERPSDVVARQGGMEVSPHVMNELL